MQYHKFIIENTIIEFHNNWLGEETVILNGQIVSKHSSFKGMHHHFSAMEQGRLARYVLTSKVTEMMQVALDLRRNGKILHEDVIIRIGSRPKTPPNKDKNTGIELLNEYDLDSAIIHLKKGLDIDVEDPEIYFHLACAYSVKENVKSGFEALKMAVKYDLAHPEMILNHEFLAFLRIHPAFEAFMDSGFTQIDESLF